MAGKKLPKDIDFAAGFFSNPSFSDNTHTEEHSEKIKAPATAKSESKNGQAKEKNVGGRPKKDGLKNEQFTLTMSPELYEKLRIVAAEHTRGNFSGLVDEAIKVYCIQSNINLDEIEVASETLEIYRKKQEKKNKKKK